MIIGPLLVSTFLAASSGATVYVQENVEGATLNIEIHQPIREEKVEEIIAWVRSAALTVNKAYGRFPNPSPRIVVIPSTNRFWNSSKAVSFGRVTRRGRATIELYVNANRPIEEFYADWTATHEFSHLMLPLLPNRHRWISEGFASYYQNILMSRAGHYSAEQAWRKLAEGFDRGRRSQPRMTPNEAAAARGGASRMKIYWSGAAIALLADVELRRRSGGEQSLDTVLGDLQECCLPARRTWSGTRLFKKLDSFVDEPVFMPLYHQYANRSGFPDTQGVLMDLGIEYADGNAVLRNDRPLSWLRQAID